MNKNILLTFLFLILIFYFNNCKGQGTINVKGGSITIRGMKNCTIKTKYWNYTCYNCDNIDGNIFGLIHYKCDTQQGVIPSTISCNECNDLCRREELMIECPNEYHIFYFGCMIGTLMSFIIMIAFHEQISQTFINIIQNFNFNRAMRNDQKEVIMSTMMSERLNSPVKPIFKEIKKSSIGDKKYEIIMAKRAAILALCVVSNACNENLLIRSNFNYCHSKKCEILQSNILTMTNGNNVCLFGDENINITIKESGIDYLMKPIYRTGQLSIIVNSLFLCKWEDNECNSSNCYHGYIHSNYKNNQHDGYGCISKTLGDSRKGLGCLSSSACAFYSYDLKAYNLKYVYKTIRIQKYVTLSIESGTMLKTVTLTSDVSTYRHNDFSIELLNIFSDDTIMPTYAIDINNKVYFGFGSEVNEPRKNTIGDVQVDLLNNTIVSTDKTNIICTQGNGNSVECLSPKAYIESMNFINGYRYKENNDGNIIVDRKVRSKTTLMFTGNVNKEVIENSKCLFKIDHKFSCTNCEEQNFVILSPYKVESEGEIEFTSNCSFSHYTMSCSLSQNILYYDVFNKYCNINIKNTNQSLDIINNNMLTISLQNLDYNYFKSSDTFVDKVTSSDFVSGFAYMTFGTISVCALANLLGRLVQVMYVERKLG